MNMKILATVSAVAMMAMAPIATPAHAADDSTASGKASIHGQAARSNETETDLKRMKADPDQVLTKEEAKKGWEDTKEAVSEAVDDVEYTLFGKEPKGVESSITAGATASGLLNKPVNGTNNQRIGTLRDIIVDGKGNAQMAIVSDSEVLNLGKEAAFDYSLVLRRNADGDVVMPLTEESMKNASRFSYDTKDAGKNGVKTIPSGAYSVEKLLEANVVNARGEKVASVDNMTFRNGRADALIVGFDKVMGMGGQKAALSFPDVKMINKGDGKVEFQLTAAQAAQFETFKQSASN